MEIIGKLLFLVLFSISIGAGAVYVVGPNFFTSNLDQNLFDTTSYEEDKVDVKEYRKKLSAEYQAYSEKAGTQDNKDANEYEPLWEESYKK